ncbi:MAG: hypothetical protein IKC56_03130, partial [Clostridia bacterium]|nr:hypothetical protein [Clostridia bacterium]
MALSPMMRHHQAVKEEYPDCIVFYRLGDFYEMFFDDAVTASAILDLTLTGRDCGLEERAPMCGVPYHAAEGYIAKLVQAGKKVAVCEQLSDPATTKGMVERGVVRVVSAGTLTDDTQLNEKENNFISMVFGDEKGIGLAWADITTGEFFATEFHGEEKTYDLIDRLTRLNPAEVFANYEICNAVADLPAVKHHVLPNFQTYRDAQFAISKTEAKLKKQFEVLSLFGMIPEGKNHAVQASGALVFLLEETQKHELKNIREVHFEDKGDGLVLVEAVGLTTQNYSDPLFFAWHDIRRGVQIHVSLRKYRIKMHCKWLKLTEDRSEFAVFQNEISKLCNIRRFFICKHNISM